MFCRDGKAYIIDFDLMAKERVCYPSGYNHYQIGEQHRDARCDRPRWKQHDCFALHVVLKNTELFKALTQQQKEVLGKLLDQDELSTVSEQLLAV